MKKEQLSLKKKLLYSGIVFLLIFVSSIAALETYVRISRSTIDLYILTGRIRGPNPMAKWALLDAFSAFRAKPGEYSEGKTVNRHGFISTPEIDVHKPADAYRIVFLGGSSTAGTGANLKDTDTWPWKTVELIRNKTGKNVDFINGALGGYTSFESYGRLWSRIRHFSPDIVVVYHGWNEMYYFDQVDEIVSWKTLPDGSWSFRSTRKAIKSYEPHWMDPILRWSQGLTRIRLRLSRHFDGEVGSSNGLSLSSQFDHRGLDIWRTNLRLLRETCKVIGSKILVAKQATLIVPGLTKQQRERCRYNYHGFDHDAHVEAFQCIYDVINQEIPIESVIDVTQISGRPECFYDHIHPTPRGTTEIAKIMSDALIPLIEE